MTVLFLRLTQLFFASLGPLTASPASPCISLSWLHFLLSLVYFPWRRIPATFKEHRKLPPHLALFRGAGFYPANACPCSGLHPAAVLGNLAAGEAVGRGEGKGNRSFWKEARQCSSQGFRVLWEGNKGVGSQGWTVEMSDSCLREWETPEGDLGSVEGPGKDVDPGSKVWPIVWLWFSLLTLGCRDGQWIYIQGRVLTCGSNRKQWGHCGYWPKCWRESTDITRLPGLKTCLFTYCLQNINLLRAGPCSPCNPTCCGHLLE